MTTAEATRVLSDPEASVAARVAALRSLPAEALAGAERELQALEALLDRNPLQLVEPYPKQRDFLLAREQVKAFFGGNGAGKTWVGILDDLVQLVDRDVLPPQLLPFKRWEPPFFLRVVAPKMAVVEGVILEKFRELTPRDQLRGGSFDKAYNKQDRKLWFANGSWVLFNTADQDRDAHAGVELHRAHFDEEPEGEHGKGIYTENVARLRRFLPEAQIMFTMTPLFGLSWTFDEVWERRDEDAVRCVIASMRDNPHIDAEATIRALGHLSEAERQAVVEGKFVAFHGTVVDVREEHVVEPLTPKHVQGLDVLVGIDPGIARGGVVWAGFDRDNVMVVFDELYPQSMTVEEIALAIKAKNAAWGIEPLYNVIDPSARNRSLVNAQSVEAEFQKFGIYCAHGQNDRLAGVLQLRGRLEHQGLFIARNCDRMLWEARRWLVAEDEESGKGDVFKTKGPDHLWDPARYICMERLWHQVPARQTSPAGRAWIPGTAPPARWLLGRTGAGEHSSPMGSMS